MSSARHWAQSFSFRPGLGFSPSANAPSITRWVSRPLVVRCTAPGKTKRRWDGSLYALAFFLLENLGVRHEVVSALSALDDNNP